MVSIAPEVLSQTRALVPARIKRPVRWALDAWLSARHGRKLRRGTVELRRQAGAGAVSEELLADLRVAWGNEGWSADVSYLSAVTDRMLHATEDCLECGGGLTTLVAGVLAEIRGVTLWSLEDDEAWARHVTNRLTTLGVGNVTLWHTPLRNYGEFAWYDLAGRTLPPRFSYVFCDGPAIAKRPWPTTVHESWRMGVVPVLQERKIPFQEILLDDGDDPRSSELVRQWATLGVRTRIVDSPTGPFILGWPDDATPPPSRH